MNSSPPNAPDTDTAGAVTDPGADPSTGRSRRLRDRWRSIEAQRRVGRTMIGAGLVGALVAVVGTVSGWLFVGQIGSATDDSLEVTIETLAAVDDTIDLADDVLGSTTDAVDALAGTLAAVSGSFDDGTTAIVDIADLAETVGPSIDEAASAVRQLASVGDDIDSVLSALDNIPFGPDYNPSNGLGETFGRVADALEPLPEQLSTTSQSLTEFTDSAGTLQDELTTLATSVAGVSSDLGTSDALVDQYRASVDDALALATATRDDLTDNVQFMRILIVVGGLTFAIGQIVPLWIGRQLLDDADFRSDARRG
ncbi:MAG: hypothetical protein WBP59_02090 [Ilumatobacteraceae bacterium]